MKILLDTCVVSELVAPRPAPAVIDWSRQLRSDDAFLSVVSIGEIRRGIARLPDSGRRRELTAWLEDDLLVRFRNRTLALDLAIMLRWGSLVAEMQQKNQSPPLLDSLIAATALTRKLTVATRNARDFGRLGCHVVDPWTSSG